MGVPHLRCGQSLPFWSTLLIFARAIASALCLLSTLLCGSAQAQTTVSGSIAADVRWSLGGSPYVVSGEVLIQGGARLTVDAGVAIYMAPDASVTVQSGSVQMLGLSANPIHIRSDKTRLGQSPGPGDWNQWIFTSGTRNTLLEHVVIEHGKGLRVLGSAPTFNFVDLRNHQGAAISIDLAASPEGVGNVASGNTVNGVAVPPGDVTGTVRWGLRGIPYVVDSGTVSVGQSPVISAIVPSSLEVGATADVVVSGSRLAGVDSAAFSNPRLGVVIKPGGTDSQFTLTVTAPADAAFGATDLMLLLDAGELMHGAALIVKAKSPRLTRVTPTQVFTGQGSTVLQIEGENLRADTVAQIDGQSLATTVLSATRATATLPEQTAAATLALRLRTPDPAQPGTSMLTDALQLVVVQPQPTLTPNKVSMFQGNTQVMTLALPFAAPAGGLRFTLASNAPLIAGVQATVDVGAGETSAQFDIRGAGIGAATVTASRAGWAAASVPVTVVDPPRRIDLTPIVSPQVGLQIGTAPAAPPVTPTYAAPAVGLIVGASAVSASPDAVVVGTTITLTVQGTGLSGVSAVRADPADGLTFTTPVGSADGRSLTVQVTAAETAAKTSRRLVLATATGEVVWSDRNQAQLLVTAPVPVIESITPQVVVAGQPAVKLTLRGKNFRDISGLRFQPADGLAALGSPSFNADGTLLEVSVQADAAAASGPRVLILAAAAGESSALATSANTVQVARTAGTRFQDIVSPQVGLQIGQPPAVNNGVPSGANATPVGILVGAAASAMSPKSGTRGESLTLQVQGAGLQAVTGVSFTPDTGIMVGSPVVSADGRQLSVPVSIDFNAPATVREVTLLTATGRVAFAVPLDNQFNVQLIVGTRFESMSSPLVGVQIGNPVQQQAIPTGPHRAPTVGLIVGAAASSLVPDAGVVGTSVNLVLQGVGLGAVTSVTALPGDGLVFGMAVVAADGRSLTVPVEIAADAPKTSRRIQLRTASGEVPFHNLLESQFLVTAPIPRLESITPQVVVAGQGVVRLTVRGSNFRDITGVRFAPADGLVAAGSPSFNSEGTVLQVDVQAEANAASGQRTLIVQAAAGESSATASAANTVQVVRTAGTRFQDILSAQVGVQIGNPNALQGAGMAAAPGLGLIVGPAVTSMAPSGSIKGDSGQWEFTGYGLGSVTGVRLVGPDGAVDAASNLVRVGPATLPGLKGEYFNNTELSGAPVLTRREAVAFDWDVGSPDAGIVNTDQFSARWSGHLSVPATGAYVFRVVSDNGVRLTINGVRVIDHWLVQDPNTLEASPQPLTAGQKLPLTLEWFEYTGRAYIRLEWKPPGSSEFTAIPVEQLSSPEGVDRQVNSEGTRLTVPYAVNADAPSRLYRVDLLAGTEVVRPVRAGSMLWEVVAEPRIDSVSPVSLRQGRSETFRVRGANLSRVSAIVFEPDSGIQVASAPQWATDSFGEVLSVQILVAADAPAVPRVVRLRTPAGLTTAAPSAANVVNVEP